MAGLCLISWLRSPHPRRTALLELLRFTCTFAVVLLLWQPEWRTTIHPDAKPEIAILWDDSLSMTTVDATLPTILSGKSEVVSRSEWVKKILSSDIWDPLKANGANQIVKQPFATPPLLNPAIAGTDIEGPLTRILDKQSNLRAVILLSDGDCNLGQPPVVAAQKFRLRHIPIYPITVGSKVRLPDLDLLSVTAPTYGIVGENVQIPFTIRSSLNRQVRTIVRLRDESGKERTKDIVIQPNTETYDSILWRLEKQGSSTLDISIPVAEGELIESNNYQKFTIAGRPEKIRVLVIDTLPRWEYRFLRNALSRDPGVEVSCLLMQPTLGSGEGTDYLKEFPTKIEELAKYDVIFLGDIGMGPEQLTQEQCSLIRGLVENQASGLIFMPGPQGNQLTLLESDLSDLMPVILDQADPKGIAEATPSPLNLTTEGRASLLTLLGNNEEDNPEIWRHLPGFYWYAPVIKAKGGAEVLAVHGNRRGKYGPIPLLVTKSAGSGKVLFMGIDSAWRWRRGVEDLYHYRFWGQVARWMSYQRNMASGQRIRLFFNPERPEAGTSITLNANAFDPNGAPLQKGHVTVDVTAPDGETQRIELQKNESTWGTFSGRVKVDLPGAWKLRATTNGAEDQPLDTTILVQGSGVEKVGQPARPEILEELAKVSRGRVIDPDQITDLITEIRALPEPKPLESRFPLGSHWGTLTALVLLLGVFWVGRKLNGSV